MAGSRRPPLCLLSLSRTMAACCWKSNFGMLRASRPGKCPQAAWTTVKNFSPQPQRELEEETQFHADKWEQLEGETQPFNAFSPERNILFIARGLHKAKNPSTDNNDAIIELESFTWTELKRMIKEAAITDGQTITSLVRAGLHLGKEIEWLKHSSATSRIST
jgi:hypothetical protein